MKRDPIACKYCGIDKRNLITLEDAKNAGKPGGWKLVNERGEELTEREFEKIILSGRSRGIRPSRVLFKWIHSTCGKVSFKCYTDMKQDPTVCKNCKLLFGNSKIYQRAAHLSALQIFPGSEFEIEEKIVNIFSGCGLHGGIEVDSYCPRLKGLDESGNIITLKDNNGKVIKLAIERQGEQHSKNRDKALRTLEYLTHGKYEGAELERMWKKRLDIDRRKVKVFKSHEGEGYYLIVVPDDVKKQDMQGFIAKEFERQTKTKLHYRVISYAELLDKFLGEYR